MDFSKMERIAKSPVGSTISTRKGLDAEVVKCISEAKREPEWMRDFRLKGLELFQSKPMPEWGADLSHLDVRAHRDVPRHRPQSTDVRFHTIGAHQNQLRMFRTPSAYLSAHSIHDRLH
jgi:hypothetical protein